MPPQTTVPQLHHNCAGQARLEALLRGRALFREHTGSEDALQAVLGKLVVVEGDVHRQDCGLRAADLERVRAEVEVVIHSAASISFFEHIHVLLQQNYQVLHALFCMQIPGL